jgi:carbamoyltransferase
MNILGISAFYHDSAAALVCDGRLTFASQEERYSRIKQDNSFPVRAIAAALEHLSISLKEIDLIAWYEDPDLKFSRSKMIVKDNWPRSYDAFLRALNTPVSSKTDVINEIGRTLNWNGPVDFHTHHESHMSSALFGRQGHGKTLALTIDAIGEFESGTGYLYDFDFPENHPIQVWKMKYPNSIGLLYSAITQLLGFEVNEGEYKVMGLASYGSPIYHEVLQKALLDKSSSLLNPVFRQGFALWEHSKFSYGKKLLRLFEIESVNDLSFKRRADIASSIQYFLEQTVLGISRQLISRYNPRSIVMAGGVALNCTLNARLARELNIPVNVQPAAGDAGGAVGAALMSAFKKGDLNVMQIPSDYPVFIGAGIGTEVETKSFIEHVSKIYKTTEFNFELVANMLANGKVVGVCQGRAEFGPRALGNRCILASPLTAGMRDHLNSAIKFREEFRPFAPVVREIDYNTYFEQLLGNATHHMLFTVKSLQPDKIPAVTHVDGTSRVQCLKEDANPYLWNLLASFGKITGVPVLTLTSFNLKGEPMVQNAWDALNTFERSGMDALIVDNTLIIKNST